MSKLEKNYLLLPIWLQNIALSGAGWLVNQRRYTKTFDRFLSEYQQREFSDEQVLLEYRDRRLRQALQHAVDTVPYYRELFRNVGCDVNDICTLADLERLPILEKSYLQAHQKELVSTAFRAKNLVIHHTSGSTGAGLRFPSTHDAMIEQWAVW